MYNYRTFKWQGDIFFCFLRKNKNVSFRICVTKELTAVHSDDMWRHIQLLWERTNACVHLTVRFYSTESLLFAGWDEDGQLTWTALRSRQHVGRRARSSHQGENGTLHPNLTDSLNCQGYFRLLQRCSCPCTRHEDSGRMTWLISLLTAPLDGNK